MNLSIRNTFANDSLSPTEEEFQGHHTNQAYYKLGIMSIMSPEYTVKYFVCHLNRSIMYRIGHVKVRPNLYDFEFNMSFIVLSLFCNSRSLF